MKDLKIGYEDEDKYYLNETVNEKYFVLNSKKTYITISIKKYLQKSMQYEYQLKTS